MAEPERVYAVGDIHGHIDKLRDIHERIALDLARRQVASHMVVHIGDYTDRGPASDAVIDHLIAGAADGRPWINLYGNHDRMFRLFLEEPGGRDPRLHPDYGWLSDRLGGRETLKAYGLEVPDDTDPDGADLWRTANDAVPRAHVAFLQSLTLSWKWRDVLFVHAGVRPGMPLNWQIEDDLIWIRGEFHDSSVDHGALIVHGHTPVDKVEDHGNRIAIDTGAAYGGPLSCVVFEGEGVTVLGGDRLR